MALNELANTIQVQDNSKKLLKYKWKFANRYVINGVDPVQCNIFQKILSLPEFSSLELLDSKNGCWSFISSFYFFFIHSIFLACWLVWQSAFYGISTLLGYSMANLFIYTYNLLANSFLVNLFSNKLFGLINLRTVKWFQVFFSNMHNCIWYLFVNSLNG